MPATNYLDELAVLRHYTGNKESFTLFNMSRCAPVVRLARHRRSGEIYSFYLLFTIILSAAEAYREIMRLLSRLRQSLSDGKIMPARMYVPNR